MAMRPFTGWGERGGGIPSAQDLRARDYRPPRAPIGGDQEMRPAPMGPQPVKPMPGTPAFDQPFGERREMPQNGGGFGDLGFLPRPDPTPDDVIASVMSDLARSYRGYGGSDLNASMSGGIGGPDAGSLQFRKPQFQREALLALLRGGGQGGV